MNKENYKYADVLKIFFAVCIVYSHSVKSYLPRSSILLTIPVAFMIFTLLIVSDNFKIT